VPYDLFPGESFRAGNQARQKNGGGQWFGIGLPLQVFVIPLSTVDEVARRIKVLESIRAALVGETSKSAGHNK